MPPLIPCPACSRHVYSHETACPFCEAKLPRPRSVRPGLAAAAGLALLATGCPEREQADVYGAPPPNIEEPAPDDTAPVDSGSEGSEDAAPVEPDDEDSRPRALYGAVEPPQPPPVAPDDPGERESVPKYGAPPPPPRDTPR